MRVLITGLGSIGRRHLRLLRENPAVSDIVALRRQATGEYDDVEEYEDVDRALSTSPDVAFVTNPTFKHVETAVRCAEAGCHLFVEKPLSHSMDGVTRLCSVVEEQSLTTMVGCQLRFSPVLEEVHRIMEEGRHGAPLSFEAYSGSYLPDWRPESDYRESYSADPEAGGGAVLDLIHELDYSHWLFGPFADVCGQIGQVSSLEIESEDVGVMALHGEDNLGTIHVDYCRPTPRRTLEVVCEEGVVHADLVHQELTVEADGERNTMDFEYTRDDMFRRQIDHFLTAVENGERTYNPLSEGKEVLELALNAKSNSYD